MPKMNDDNEEDKLKNAYLVAWEQALTRVGKLSPGRVQSWLANVGFALLEDFEITNHESPYYYVIGEILSERGVSDSWNNQLFEVFETACNDVNSMHLLDWQSVAKKADAVIEQLLGS